MIRSLAFAAAIAGALFAAGADAQPAPPPAEAPPSQGALAAQVGAATLTQPISNETGIQFTANQTATAVTGKFGLKTPWGAFNLLSLTGSAPLTSGATAIDLSSLDTMANGASLTLTASGLYVRRRALNTDAIKAAVFQKKQAMCAELWQRVNAAKGLAPGAAGYTPLTKDCQASDFADAGEFDLQREEQELFFTGPVIFWGLSGKVGYQQYKFFETTTLAPQLLRSTPWSFGGYLALQPSVATNQLVTFSYQHQFGYDPSASKVACPTPLTTAAACVDGTIGPPARTTKDLLTLDLRARLDTPLLFGLPFGVELTPSYDARNRVWAINAPLYVIAGKKQDLTGGVAVGWRSDTHATTVGVFLNKSLGFAPSL